MPYLITTKRPGMKYISLDPDVPTIHDSPIESHRTVATLDEARETASDALWQNGAEPDSWRLDALTESGGTVGPLPDGTVIEVRRADEPKE